MCGHGSPSITLPWLFSTRCQSTLLWAATPPQILGTGEKQLSPWRRYRSSAAACGFSCVELGMRGTAAACGHVALSFSFVR
jgi:hypothetical protein